MQQSSSRQGIRALTLEWYGDRRVKLGESRSRRRLASFGRSRPWALPVDAGDSQPAWAKSRKADGFSGCRSPHRGGSGRDQQSAGQARLGLSFLAACGLAVGAGCGAAVPTIAVAPVSGTVFFEGQPVEHAAVRFIPIEGTPGSGGSARTDADGRYSMQMPQRRRGFTGERVMLIDGLPPGRYRVVISRRLHADGTPMRPEEIPIESPARETIALLFSDEARSQLVADVPTEGGTFDWQVEGSRR